MERFRCMVFADMLSAEQRRDLVDYTLGEGAEVVYAYYNPRERELAEHQGRDAWPCKVGFTTRSDPWDRILEQSSTDASFRPRLVVFRTSQGRALERFFHQSCPKVEGAMGSEWRMASPRLLRRLYNGYRYRPMGECTEVRKDKASRRPRITGEAARVFRKRAQDSGLSLTEYFSRLAQHVSVRDPVSVQGGVPTPGVPGEGIEARVCEGTGGLACSCGSEGGEACWA